MKQEKNARMVEELQKRVRDLERETSRLERVIEAAQIGTWEWDYRSGTLTVNDRWLEMLGYSRKEFPGSLEAWRRWTHPEDRDKTLALVEQTIRTGRPYVARFRMKHRDGHWVWIQGSGNVVKRDESGNALRLGGTNQDITRQVATQQQLVEEKERAQLYLENVNMMMLALDRNGIVTLVNRKSCDLLEYGREELIGKNWFRTVLSESVAEEVYAYFLDLMSRGEAPESFENEVLTRSGERRLIRWNNHLLLDAEGHSTGVLSSGEDITERRYIQDALAESEARYRQLFEKNRAIKLLIDPENGRILDANRSAIAFYGYPKETLLQMNISQINTMTPEEIAQEMEAAQREERTKFYFSHRLSDGRVRYVEVLSGPIRFGDREMLYSIILDVTPQRISEAKLRQSEQKFRTLFESAPLGIGVTDRDGRFVAGNRVLKDMIGYTAEELSATNFLDLTHAADTEENRKRFTALVEGRIERYSMQKRYVHKEGSLLWVNATVSRIENGETNAIAIIEDISGKRANEEALRESQRRLRTLIDNIPGAVYRSSDAAMEGIEYISDAVHALTGYTPEAFYARKPAYHHIVSPEDREMFLETLAAGEDAFELRYRIITADGQERWVMDLGRRVVSQEGKPILEGLLIDITQTVAYEKQLTLLAEVFESSNEGIIITDAAAKILTVNKTFSEITGYTASEAIGETPQLLNSGMQGRDFFQSIWHSLEEVGFWHGEIWNRRKDGQVYPEWLNVSVVRGDFGEVTNYIGVFSDISRMKESEQRLEFLAHYDALTQLPNRLLLQTRVEHLIEVSRRKQREFAFCVLDIDNFKNINDSYGHTVGDQIITVVGTRLVDALRESDLVARIGGDEFAIVVEEYDNDNPAALLVLIQKVLALFAEAVVIEGQELYVSVSIGVSLYPRDGESIEVLLKNADAAMYEAKAEGKNTFHFYTSKITEQMFEKVMLESNLRRAEAHGELRVYYQPQIDLSGGSVSGMEALLRWQHPSLGMVMPGKFIAAAEESGLIVEMGAFIMRESCRTLKAWHDAGIFTGKVAVNVSGVQLEKSDFSAMVREVLAETGLSPELLEVEVTETYVMRQPEKTVELLGDLKQLGISIAIDDFGTGYSSLSYLRKLPIDKLKVDQSFIRDIPDAAEACGIVNAVIALAQSLGMKTLAEGVELQEQAAYLTDNGCDEVQGYYYGRPMDRYAFEAWLAKWSETD